MRNFLLLILSILGLISSRTYAQINIGTHYDINGILINGDVNSLLYSPEKELFKNYTIDGFELGCYYDKEGVKHEGVISYGDKKISYKKSIEDKKSLITLRANEVKSVRIGIDSFFVTNNFKVEKKLLGVFKKKQAFVQYITSFDSLIFAKHYNLAPLDSKVVTHLTYLVKRAGDDTWDSFPIAQGAFKKKALAYFGHIPYLANKINDGDVSQDDILSFIKASEYESLYKNGEYLGFDEYWNETRNENEEYYKAKISSRKDSIWTIDYYLEERKIYSIQYSSFYPFRKNGKQKAFYSNGNVKEIKSIKNDVLYQVELFYENGKPLLSYKHSYLDKEKTKFKCYYDFFNDSLGNNLITKKHAEIPLMLNQDTVMYSFIGNKLSHTYKIHNEKKYFLFSSPNEEFKIQKLQKKLNKFLIAGDFLRQFIKRTNWNKDPFFGSGITKNDSWGATAEKGRLFNKKYKSNLKYLDVVEENAVGSLLIHFRVDEKGDVLHYDILNKLHPKLNVIVADFLEKYFHPDASYRFSFKPCKVNKLKVSSEFVIPFTFDIGSFYRKSNHFYFTPSFFMNQNMMHMNMPFRAPMPSISF